MPDDLYDRDGLAWAETQAALLRRLAAGERVNASIDWEHVIEEIEDVGLSQLHSCSSLFQQAMLHLLNLSMWPDSPDVRHWHDEVGAFLDRAGQRYAPSMRSRIALETSMPRPCDGCATGSIACRRRL